MSKLSSDYYSTRCAIFSCRARLSRISKVRRVVAGVFRRICCCRQVIKIVHVIEVIMNLIVCVVKVDFAIVVVIVHGGGRRCSWWWQ